MRRQRMFFVYILTSKHHYASIRYAIAREKQIKAGSRRKKIGLIEEINKEWRELWPKDGGD